MILQLAFRNLFRQKRRFILLCLAITLGFVIMTVTQALIAGMVSNLYSGGSRYYGGHVLVHESNKGLGYDFVKDPGLMKIITETVGAYAEVISYRMHIYDSGSIFFNGQRSPLRRIIGYEWLKAPKILGGLKIEGSFENISDSDGIFISRQIADRLGIKIGDRVTVQATTASGSTNTLQFIVRSIFSDSNLFGTYTAYTDIDLVRKLGNYPDKVSSTIGISLKDYRDMETISFEVRRALEAHGYNLFRPGPNREYYFEQLGEIWEGDRVAVLTLGDHLYKLRDLILALRLSSAGFLFLISFIIVIGIFNTYRVIVRERVREIGTLRALGLKKGATMRLFFGESLILGAFSALAGTLLSLVVLLIIQNMDLSNQRGIEIFLYDAHLSWKIYFEDWVINLVLILSATFLGSLIPAFSAQNTTPAVALRIE